MTCEGEYENSEEEHAQKGISDHHGCRPGAGEIDQQYFNTHLTPNTGIEGGWLRFETGPRSETTRRRLVTSDLWAGARRTFPGRKLFYGARSVYSLEHRKLIAGSEQVIIDQETESQWDGLGRAISGPLSGSQLSPVVSINHFWFSWAAFRPDTRVYAP